jgi:hypothetical protein
MGASGLLPALILNGGVVEETEFKFFRESIADLARDRIVGERSDMLPFMPAIDTRHMWLRLQNKGFREVQSDAIRHLGRRGKLHLLGRRAEMLPAAGSPTPPPCILRISLIRARITVTMLGAGLSYLAMERTSTMSASKRCHGQLCRPNWSFLTAEE